MFGFITNFFAKRRFYKTHGYRKRTRKEKMEYMRGMIAAMLNPDTKIQVVESMTIRRGPVSFGWTPREGEHTRITVSKPIRLGDMMQAIKPLTDQMADTDPRKQLADKITAADKH